MVIELSTAFALRCSGCGDIKIDQINVFQLSGNQKHKIYCECSNEKSIIQKKGKYIEITFYCILCDYEHKLIIPEKKFWLKDSYNSLVCPNTDLNLGYYGSYKKIIELIKKQQEDLNSMANELGFDDFANPEILLEVLDYLHDIAARGDLSCECGSYDIYIDLASDEVRLSCGYCNSQMSIPAASRKDLIQLRKSDKLQLESSSGTGNSKDPWINM
ncbi:MAG: hypothetical protein ACOCRB_00260 [Halanaerobiaceae bacterium]